MKTHVSFRSPRFAANAEDWTLINSGGIGLHVKRLAEFIAIELAKRDFQSSEPIEEDWGWIIDIKNGRFRLSIGCGDYFENDDGFLCFIEPHQPTIRPFPWFRRIDTTSEVGALRHTLDDILANEPSVTDKQWWTYDEFNSNR